MKRAIIMPTFSKANKYLAMGSMTGNHPKKYQLGHRVVGLIKELVANKVSNG